MHLHLACPYLWLGVDLFESECLGNILREISIYFETTLPEMVYAYYELLKRSGQVLQETLD
jgi:hypothetical protein